MVARPPDRPREKPAALSPEAVGFRVRTVRFERRRSRRHGACDARRRIIIAPKTRLTRCGVFLGRRCAAARNAYRARPIPRRARSAAKRSAGRPIPSKPAALHAICRQRRAQRQHRRALPVAPLPGLHARERGEAVARVRQQQHIATSQGYAVRLPAEQQVVHLAVRRARQAHMALHGYGDAEFHALPRILREPSVRAQCVLSEANAQAASLVERGIGAVGG